MAKNVQYAGVKPEAFDQLKSKLQQMGLSLKGNSGNISEKGVSAKYDYNPEAEMLAIDDLKVGFPASMMLNSDSLVQRLTQIVEQHGGRATA
ncbi:hypothetical protein ACFSKU_08660 [Pontibacter silvestris]|uniref:Uncharacterized protein n=1 Tax=Pontibacter silvestris TaxID=2305183 RepID=A0ABW4WW39_9BACT|nr:hypothetical protein [Pontibacter silvestris]MCC9137448.1 hypothetical protein [Pontibacter silvestris]